MARLTCYLCRASSRTSKTTGNIPVWLDGSFVWGAFARVMGDARGPGNRQGNTCGPIMGEAGENLFEPSEVCKLQVANGRKTDIAVASAEV